MRTVHIIRKIKPFQVLSVSIFSLFLAMWLTAVLIPTLRKTTDRVEISRNHVRQIIAQGEEKAPEQLRERG